MNVAARDKSKDSRVLPTLGPVETEVMDLVWNLKEATVRDVYRTFLLRREIAYTTVMTIMNNLAKKGILNRSQRGRAYAYAPAFSRDDFTRAMIVEIVDGMLDRFTEPAMTYLVDRMARVNPQQLALLEEVVFRRRKKKGK